MEKQLNFALTLSLKDIVFRRIAVILWNGADILGLFKKLTLESFLEKECQNEWRECVEKIVECKVSKLVLPKWMLEEIVHLVRPVGLEIVSWQIFHEKILDMRLKDFDTRFMQHFCWTSAGTIDYRKTALEVVRSQKLDVVKLFRLACVYCLEDEISTIWKEFPETCKKYFYKGEDVLHDIEPKIEFCWAYVLQEEESKLNYAPERRFENLPIFCQNAFKTSAIKGNQEAAEYFFQKLAFEEREIILVETTRTILENHYSEVHEPLQRFPNRKLSDLLCYLLFLMTPEQQMAICEDFPFKILGLFVYWPWQDHLSVISELIFAFPPENIYERYLRFVSFSPFSTRHYSFQIFQKIFPLSSTDFKKYFVGRECQSGLISLYFSSENATAVLRNVDAEDRVKLVTCLKFFRLADYLLMIGPWEFIETCLREAALAEEDRKRVKKAYVEFCRTPMPVGLQENQREIFLETLDKIYGETPMEDDEMLPVAKKLHFN